MVSALHAHGISVERGGRLVIHDLSFMVGSGHALLLKGANGAGKTTLLRALAGFLPLASGQLELEGGEAESAIGEQSHFVGHQNANKPSMTVIENLEFWSAFNDGAPETVNQAMKALDLARLAHIPAGYLSAGQRRRLGLARLLVSERSIWLLDEPTTALDVESQSALMAVCNNHVRAGGIIIAATHMPLALENSSELQLGVLGDVE